MDDSDVDLEPQLNEIAKPPSQQALQQAQSPSQPTPSPTMEQSSLIYASAFQSRPWYKGAESSERCQEQPRIGSEQSITISQTHNITPILLTNVDSKSIKTELR